MIMTENKTHRKAFLWGIVTDILKTGITHIKTRQQVYVYRKFTNISTEQKSNLNVYNFINSFRFIN